MKGNLSDPDIEALVVLARQAYRKVLARHGLLTFTAKEVARARVAMESQGQSWISPEDIRFQASIMRLRSRNLSRAAVDDAARELMEAECECDQASWERHCYRVVMMEHLRFRLPRFGGGNPAQAGPLVKPGLA